MVGAIKPWLDAAERALASDRPHSDQVFLRQSSRGPQIASFPPGIQTTNSPRGPLSDHAS